MIGRTNAGGGGSLGKSTLIVQTETGSTVTVTKGAETRGTVEKYGVWAFSGLAAGEWTVKAVKSGKTATKTVTMDGTKSVMVALAFNVIPAFTYTGDYEIVDDDDNPITTTTGNWKIRFLTSGTLTFTDLRGAADGIDVFLVGGGGGGGKAYSDPGGGGGGGYTTTAKGIVLELNTVYTVTVGSGGVGVVIETSKISNANPGGATSAFGFSAAGGTGGYVHAYVPGGSTSTHWSVSAGDGGCGGGLPSFNNAGTQVYPGKGGVDGGNGENYNASSESRKGGKGQGTTTREFATASGKLYSGGGATGDTNNGTAASGEGGSGVNTGGGGKGESTSGTAERQDGFSGIVIIRNHREGAA